MRRQSGSLILCAALCAGATVAPAAEPDPAQKPVFTDVTEAAGKAQVTDVAGVNNVETTVALNDGLSLFAKTRALCSQAVDRVDLLVSCGATHDFDSIR